MKIMLPVTAPVAPVPLVPEPVAPAAILSATERLLPYAIERVAEREAA